MSDSFYLRFLKALDRLGNVLSQGDDDETISHSVARAQARGVWWGRGMCWFLDKWKYVFGKEWEDHCGKVLRHPNKSDATFPVDAPLSGDANPNE